MTTNFVDKKCLVQVGKKTKVLLFQVNKPFYNYYHTQWRDYLKRKFSLNN